MVKNPPVRWRRGFNPWVGKIPWRRKWQPTPVFLPGRSHGQRSLVGYSPWSCKEVRYDWMTKQQAKKWILTLNTSQRKFISLLNFFFFLLETCWKYFFCSVIFNVWSLSCAPFRPPGSSAYGISQAKILEWVAISFSRESSQPRDWTCVSCLAGRFFTFEHQVSPLCLMLAYCYFYCIFCVCGRFKHEKKNTFGIWIVK